MKLSDQLYIPSTPSNLHLKKVIEHFGPFTPEAAVIPDAVNFIFICYTNRSGSNYLAELLASGQQLPIGGENLNYNTIINNSQQKSLKTFQEYLTFLVNHTKKNNHVVIKAAPAHLELLGKSGQFEQIINRSKFVLVERSDKLAQAISHLIAFQTGKFTSNMTEAKTDPSFDAAQLDLLIRDIAESYRLFSLFFARNGIIPGHVVYEQMVEDPVRTLAFIGPKIGFPDLQIAPEHVRISRQTNGLNQEWRKRYLATREEK